MKKSILVLLLLLSSVCYSQITLDFQNPKFLSMVRLNNSETKYLDDHESFSLNQFSLLNTDGTHYKTIHLPAHPDSLEFISGIAYISTTLFDNDPATIEYIVEYQLDSLQYDLHEIRIVREDGTILLDEMYAYMGAWDWGFENIYSTPEGTKMIFNYRYANGHYYQTKVFNLAGELPSGTKANFDPANNNLTLYPNPNNGSFYIDFHSKAGEANFIDLYNLEGRLIETYKSNTSLSHINNAGLSDGLFIVNTRSGRRTTSAKMIIKK
jgi:hypothetical protein